MGFLVTVPSDVLLRTDATLDDPTAEGIDDLLIADNTGVFVVHGRADAEWSNLMATDLDPFFLGSAAIAGLKDVNRDGRDDVAVLSSGTLSLYGGGALPDQLTLLSSITGVPDAGVFAAGDVDGDAANDILITGSGGNYLVFGGDLGASEVLDDLDPMLDTDLVGQGKAIKLPDGAWRAIGDFDGPQGTDEKSFADLGAAVLVTTDKLNEAGKAEHQVVNIYLGGPRETLAQVFVAPDLVFEPGRASFSDPGEETPDAIFFGPLGERTGTDGLTRVLLGVTGPAGDALRVYNGGKVAPADLSDGASGLAERPDLFEFELANATAPGFVSIPPPGLDLSNDADLSLRNAFVLEGRVEEEHLSGSVHLADFNGDGFGELLVFGDKGSYLILGPVELGDVKDVAVFADVLIAASVGRPASRMGDVTGDGLDDLVFIRPRTGIGTTPGDFEIVIIAGGNGAGVELPRVIDDAWITQVLLDPNQERVKLRTGSVSSVGSGYADPSATLAVLNWNDDGAADILIARSAVPFGFSSQAYVLSGSVLLSGTDSRASYFCA